MHKVAVVILNWNGLVFLKKFLPGIIQNSVNEQVQVFVADNGSDDGSVEYLKTILDLQNIIQLKENFGFAQGYVNALEKIDAEYYVLLNSDVEVTENWIDPVISLMDKDEHIAACMPKIRAYDNRGFFEYAGAAGGYLGKFGYPYCRGRILTEIEKDHGQYDDIVQVFWATGACMFVRAEHYRRVGGLDGDFFAHMEEIDLCWRLNNAGLKVMVQPESVVFHVGGGTLPNDNPRKLYLNFRNSLYMLYKNLPDRKFRQRFVTRMLIDGIAAFKFLFTFQLSFFLAVILAHFTFWKNRKSLKLKREAVKKLMVENPAMSLSSHFILKEFFIKKNRKYSQLNQ